MYDDTVSHYDDLHGDDNNSDSDDNDSNDGEPDPDHNSDSDDNDSKDGDPDSDDNVGPNMQVEDDEPEGDIPLLPALGDLQRTNTMVTRVRIRTMMMLLKIQEERGSHMMGQSLMTPLKAQEWDSQKTQEWMPTS